MCIRHMNSFLGVGFGQLWGQEAVTSHLIDFMMPLLQFGPVGKFQFLTLLHVPYFRSFYDLCLQSALHVL